MKYLVLFLKSRKMMILLIFFTALAEAFGILTAPYLVARIIDDGIVRQDVSAIVISGCLMLAAASVGALFSLWNCYLCADLAASAARVLREAIFDKVQQLSIKDVGQFGTASMITRSTGDITVVQQTLIVMVQMALPAPLILVAAIVMTALASPALLAIPLVATIVFGVISWLLFRKANPVSATIQGRMDAVNRVVRESIMGVRVIRAFDNTRYESGRMDRAFSEYAGNMIRLNRIFALFNPAVWTIMGLAMGTVVWFGGLLVQREVLQVGNIVAVTEYVIIMLLFLMMSAMVLGMVPRMTACLNRIQELLDITPGIGDPETAGDTELPASGGIVFEHVGFSYRGAEKPVLEAISFSCEPGKTTAIIGGTGSGKSTIAALMLRLYDIQEGRILFGGTDIRLIPQHALRERIGYVPQKAFLFSGTVADNLRMGDKTASPEELRRAAGIAQADAFISALPDGYDSPVAQGGTNFSGGQKQRLCIARALVKKAPVYLFDDCFSALDFKTDARLRGALKREIKDAAVVIIAQRISTIMHADRIIVLDAGRIAGIGRHDELLKDCRIYREIADSQFIEKEGKR